MQKDRIRTWKIPGSEITVFRLKQLRTRVYGKQFGREGMDMSFTAPAHKVFAILSQAADHLLEGFPLEFHRLALELQEFIAEDAERSLEASLVRFWKQEKSRKARSKKPTSKKKVAKKAAKKTVKKASKKVAKKKGK